MLKIVISNGECEIARSSHALKYQQKKNKKIATLFLDIRALRWLYSLLQHVALLATTMIVPTHK
uniref:Uncharacterized protein n=1 Tax=Arundo donax TaxID=35708 RepID=A0A0A8YM57_ARUDO